MGELQHVEHVVFIAIDHRQPYHGLRQELAHQRYRYAVVGHLQPFLRRAELQFRAQRVGRYQEDKQHNQSWYQHRRQVRVVTGPRVGYLVQVYAYGLQECLYLGIRESLGAHRGLTYCCRAQCGDGLQVLHQQGTRRQCGI